MVIAITGTIGSGKSTVARILKTEGFNVINCDKINSYLLNNSKYLTDLKKLFPFAFSNNYFDKDLFSQVIFSNYLEREKLNKFSHPYHLRILRDVIDLFREKLFVEIPILEKEFFSLFDGIIYLEVSQNLQLGAIATRENCSLAEAYSRIAIQHLIQFNELNIPVYKVKNDYHIEHLKDNLLKIRTLLR